MIHVIVAQGTVDELMVKRLDKKEAVQFKLLDHLRSPL